MVRSKGWISTGSRPPVHSYCPFGRRGRPEGSPAEASSAHPVAQENRRHGVATAGAGTWHWRPDLTETTGPPGGRRYSPRWAPSPAEDVCGVGTPPAQEAARRPCTPPATALLHLQRTARNTAVAAYLQGQRSRQSAPEMDVDAGEPRATAPEETRRAGRAALVGRPRRFHWRAKTSTTSASNWKRKNRPGGQPAAAPGTAETCVIWDNGTALTGVLSDSVSHRAPPVRVRS